MSTSRHAYTLFELLVVMAILVVVAALAAPSLDSMYGDYKVTAAADQVRAGWARAKAQAVEEGRPYRFAVIPGKGNYCIAPDSSEYWGDGEPPEPEDAERPPFILKDSLPKGITFALASDSGSPSDSGDTTASENVASSDWVTQAIFLPDGTARDDVEVRFQASGARTVVLRLRALTGSVTSETLAPERGGW